MTEHLIRTWAKFNGTWDVTHHSNAGGRQDLIDDPKDFRNFPAREEAEVYAKKLFKKFSIRNNSVTLNSPDSFGQETQDGCWQYFCGEHWIWEWERGVFREATYDAEKKYFVWREERNGGS